MVRNLMKRTQAALVQLFLLHIVLPIKFYFERNLVCWSSDTAFQTMYRQEFVQVFEAQQSLLRDTVTTEAQIKGNTAVFLVAGTGGATAVSRGVNGLIPPRSNDLTQNSCVLSEWHDLVRMTNFNIFASQGNQRQIMQKGTVAVINRKIDSQIITELNTGTITVGAASATPTVSLFQNARVKLTNASVPWGDGNITFLCGASYLAFLEEAPEFAHADYVNIKPYAGSDENPSWKDKMMGYRWRNTLIIEHPAIPGKATTSEKAFLYHRDAIGHAANSAGMDSVVGYNEEQAYSYARASLDMGAKLLQNTGVVVFTYDGTIYG